MKNTSRKIKRRVKVVAEKVSDAGSQVKRGTQVAANKALDVGNQVKQGVQETKNKMTDTGKEVKRTVQTGTKKVVDAGSQVKQGARAVADKAADAGNQIKRGAQAVTEKVTDAGDDLKRGAQAAADKAADLSSEVSRTIQTTTVKVADAGGEIARSAQVTAIKVIDAGQEKLLDIKVFADQYWNKFSKEVGDASQRYTAIVTDSLIQANHKLKESTEVIDPDGAIRKGAQKAAVAVGAATVTAYNQILAASPAFGELPQALRVKFAAAGMREVWRTMPAAESFYDSSLPGVIKNFGKDAVVEFLDGKHASHIKSVKIHPELAMENSNIVWEAAKYNLRRGHAEMTGLELARANALNIIDAAGIVAGRTLQIAAKAGCVGMALEGVVSLGENMIYVYAGERSVKEAAVDMSKNMAKKGVLAAVSGVVVSVAIAFGAGPALSAMAPVMVTIGGTVFLIGAVNRIAGAYNEVKPELAISAKS